ncbi:hypothetical protein DFH06DRAFT_146642 [Mycena polygramma]|nr:hypothetical protein DFH06DRAFT_146642 [Mycena polygramma]
MGRPAILLNPVVRVWNLRFLLLCILAIVVWWPLPGSNDEVYGHFTVLDLGKVLNVGQIVICCCLGLVHHTLVLVQWQLKGLALIDLSVTLVEIGGELLQFLSSPYSVREPIIRTDLPHSECCPLSPTVDLTHLFCTLPHRNDKEFTRTYVLPALPFPRKLRTSRSIIHFVENIPGPVDCPAIAESQGLSYLPGP